MPSTYNIGMATVDITPAVGGYMSGLSRRTTPSVGVYHPLRAVATAIDDGGAPLLFLTADWIGFYADLAPRMRAAITQLTGVPAERVVLMGTHTHCGPALCNFDQNCGNAIDPDYVTRSIAAMAACVRDALGRRQPSVLRWGEGSCDFACSRRRPDEFGKATFRLFRTGPRDHRVPFLTIESPAGEVRGVLFNYACHPTAMFGTVLGGDYVGFASARLESVFPGALTGFLPGCGGDQKPVPPDKNAEDYREHTLDELRVRGNELGDTIIAEIRAGRLSPISGPLEVKQRNIIATTEPIDMADVERQLKSPVKAHVSWAEVMLQSIRTGPAVDREIPFEIQTITFGKSFAAATFAAEMSVDYGIRLRREFEAGFEHFMPIAYANDILGYIPTREQIPGEGYEVTDANRYSFRTGPYVAETEELVYATVREMLPTPSIEVTLVDPNAIAYAVFQAHNQKVVHNRHGIFITYIKKSNATYTAQHWRLAQSTDGGATFKIVYESTDPTNPPVLETDAEGNIYLACPNFENNNAYLYFFRAGRYNEAPRITTIPGGAAGKFAMMLDAPRQQLYHFAHNESFHVLALDGTVRIQHRLFCEGKNGQIQYPSLALDADGTLYAAWTTQKHGVYLYRSIHWMLSRDAGATWEKADGTKLTLPIIADDTGPADRITLDDEFDVHTWLSSFLSHGGKLHFVYWAQADRLSHGKDMKSGPRAGEPLRQRYVRLDPASGKIEVDIPWIFAGRVFANVSDGSLLASRLADPSAPLYLVSAIEDRSRLACLVSKDNRATWRDFALGATTYPTLTYCVGGARELTPDGCIIGTFAGISADAIEKTYYGDNTGSIYFYKINTAGR